MSSLVVHSGLLTWRSLMAMWRQPAYVVVTLVQPVIWLLLFGALFSKVVDIPGFIAPGSSYLDFLTPGVVMMTSLFSAAWAGTVYIEDMGLGVMDRMLASPVSRGAMMNGTLAYQSVVTVLQSLAVFAIAFAAGARFAGGWRGVAVSLVAAVLLTVPPTGRSCGLGWGCSRRSPRSWRSWPVARSAPTSDPSDRSPVDVCSREGGAAPGHTPTGGWTGSVGSLAWQA